MDIRVIHMPKGADFSEGLAIREKVFQQIDKIPRSEDFDGHDVEAEQFLALYNGTPVGTARYRIKDGGFPKIERVAVLPEYQGQAVGTAIMKAILETARAQGHTSVYLNSKVDSVKFYEKLGFSPHGEEFEDVGIPHIKMTKNL